MIDVAGGGALYYYHFDGLGSVVALSDNAGAIVERYEYSAYGQTQILSPSHEPRATSDYSNPYMFTGRRFDDETGLYYYRARMYHPELGRFIQPDPIGCLGGLNLYAYVGNSPLNWIDPWGLDRDGKRPLWKECTDIFEGSFGVKFGLELKFKLLALRGKIGGGIGSIPLNLQNSEITSHLERDIGLEMGFRKHRLGLGYSKKIPIELGRPMYDQATKCSTIGYSRGKVGATPWTISIGGTFIIVKGSIGINFEEGYDFFKKLRERRLR